MLTGDLFHHGAAREILIIMVMTVFDPCGYAWVMMSRFSRKLPA